MNFLVPIFLVSLNLQNVLSCKCSETLHEKFKKSFDVSYTFDNCRILCPGIFFRNENWAGFYNRDRIFLFKNWKCRNEKFLFDKPYAVAVVTPDSCKLVEDNYDFDELCFKEFNSQMCKIVTEKNIKDKFMEEMTFINDIRQFKSKNDNSFSLKGRNFVSAPSRAKRWARLRQISVNHRPSSVKPATETTSTEETSTETSSTEGTSTKTTSTEKTTTETSSTEKTTTETTSTEETTTETTSTEETTTETTSTEETTTETTSTEKSTTGITSTEETTTETTRTDETTFSYISTSTENKVTELTTLSFPPTIPFSSTKETVSPENPISSTTIQQFPVRKSCEFNEFFFNDQCYFLCLIPFWDTTVIDSKRNLEVQKQKLSTEISEDDLVLPDLNKFCRSRHIKALGLAVESKEENEFILRILKNITVLSDYTIFTSGIRVNGRHHFWQGWNKEIDENVINLRENTERYGLDVLFYCIRPDKSWWYLVRPNSTFPPIWASALMCERPYNPKNIQLELHEKCLELYRKSFCYNANSHANYCCEKDEKGEIWFACPGETYTKSYPNSLECSWRCRNDGFFSKDRPVCRGNYFCNSVYHSIRYIAPITRYAISDCPNGLWGHSTWYCGWNRTFYGTPDYSLCCDSPDSMCRDTDVFLNIWMGCPSRKVIKKTACPRGSLFHEAFVEWYCLKNGTFNNTTPDYSNCNVGETVCKNKDRFGTEWVAKINVTESKKCPPSFTGMCYWKCLSSGYFEGPEPDCTKCRANWMDEVSDKIKNSSNYAEVMNLMEHYTKKEDLRIGYAHVLNLTGDCVSLFKNQNSENKVDIFDHFLKSFSKIFKNLAGDVDLWSSFSETNRKSYTGAIIQTTQNAAFANVMSQNVAGSKYNSTLAKSKTDGFDFFVAYNPPIGSNFPLEGYSESDWHLSIKEINESNPSFAAMGLVMSHPMSSLMFPQENTSDLEINAPALTFTIGVARNGEVVDDPNVVVSISFKHKSRTRFPETKVIGRKLHHGEQPSGVFNSTVCCYYRNSEWSTEGCYTTFTSQDRTNCTCNHLSTIALLMTLHKYEPNLTLEIISVISSGITIVSLILALLIFFFVDAVKNIRVFIGKNLCFCLLIGHTLLITVMDKKFFYISDEMCSVYAIILHYSFMAAFAWMFVEGCHLYRMLILVFDSDVDYQWIYLLIGYGVPFVIVGVTKVIGLLYQEQPYGQDELCWLKAPNYIWAFVGPVIVLTSINFCILIIAMKLAISSKRRTEKSNFSTVKIWIKGWISLSTLLGVTWLFGLVYIHYNDAFVYTFVVFNGLQGFFIFLFRCVLCEQYKAIFQRKIKLWCLKSQSNYSKKSDNVKSETKEFALSAAKSYSGETDTKNSRSDPELNGLDDYQKCQNNLIFYLNNQGKSRENSCEVRADININLAPTVSEAYLRNRMIARNFSARKSKVVLLSESDEFPELSYHKVQQGN